MTAKEYLEQAYRLEQRIDSKLEQVEMMRYLTTKTSAIIRGDPGGGGDGNFMEDAIARIVDLEREIAAEICRLTELKREIAEIIGRLEEPEEQTVMEMRYLGYKRWPEIAQKMHRTESSLFKLHRKALKSIEKTSTTINWAANSSKFQ